MDFECPETLASPEEEARAPRALGLVVTAALCQRYRCEL